MEMEIKYGDDRVCNFHLAEEYPIYLVWWPLFPLLITALVGTTGRDQHMAISLHHFSPLKVREVSLTKPDTLRHSWILCIQNIEPGTTPGTLFW